MSQVKLQTKVEQFAVDNIEEAPWNVNVMAPEIFQKLLADMKQVGPDGTSPIDVVRAGDIGFALEKMNQLLYVTIHGSHRLRVAKQLGWKFINVIVHHDIHSELEARLFNYRMDLERGTIDDFKLAQAFRWCVDQGMKQEQVAEKFGLDRSTISTKLTLLTLDEDAKELMAKRPNAFGVSHMEVIASLDPKLQEQAVARILRTDALADYRGRNATITVKEVEENVKRVKELADRRQEFKDSVEHSKFPVCPICGGKPQRIQYGIELPWVACSSKNMAHEWSLETGKLRNPPRPKSTERAERPQARVEALKPDFESKLSIEHFRAAVLNFAKKKLSEIDTLESIDAFGKIGGKHVNLQISTGSASYAMDDSIEFGEGNELLYISAEEPEKKTPDHMITIGGRVVQTQAQVRKFQETASKFLSANVPRGKRKK